MPAQPEGTGLADLQRRFGLALLQGPLVIPHGIRRDTQPTRGRRFGVYRNNVKASLAAALAARFPVVARLVDEDFFTAMALVFIERHPPRSPVLAEYGAAFAEFLEGFEPAADLPYLPDIARLEWARHVAFHSADASPVDIGRLAALPPEGLGSVKLGLHPAMAIIASSWPIVSIWSTNTYDLTSQAPAADWTGETALVTRPHLEVLLHRLPPGTDRLVTALASGVALGQAAEAASRACQDFDLAIALSTLFAAGAVATLSEGSSR
ncbi:DNA-binding domain-containing protein [Reyranella sp.]|uniref:HvfC/BufC N-terminal domain-containing protein n=1 Tax=Reyranella sp. TaxID=1929291 RepID=UPI0025FE8D1E|nr:DNA-binding domain-containing protein [Reyranella sp.]